MKTNFAPILFALSFILFAPSYTFSQSIQLKAFQLNNRSNLLTDTTKLTEKSPLLAGTLSFIVPGLGLGQFYNGQIIKGVFHIIFSGAGVLFFLSGLNPGGPSAHQQSMAILGTVIYVCNWIWSVVDAIVSANEINKQVKLQKYRSALEKKLKLGFILDNNKKLKLKAIINL